MKRYSSSSVNKILWANTAVETGDYFLKFKSSFYVLFIYLALFMKMIKIYQWSCDQNTILFLQVLHFISGLHFFRLMVSGQILFQIFLKFLRENLMNFTILNYLFKAKLSDLRLFSFSLDFDFGLKIGVCNWIVLIYCSLCFFFFC